MSTVQIVDRQQSHYEPLSLPPVALEVADLTKSFAIRRGWRQMLLRPLRSERRSIALSGVTFGVREGELFGLLGPNGAGKTTLLKILSTLIEPDSGTAMVAGADLRTAMHEVRARVSPVISDERSLNWRLSATENLRLFARLYGLRNEAALEQIGALLRLVGLDGAGQKMVGAYSSGMRQRLLIARALLGDPKVLLLDEPTRSLDPVAARELRNFLRSKVAAEGGRCVLMATHDAEEGLELCDRVLVLNRGKQVSVGPPRTLLDRLGGVRYRLTTRSPSHPAIAQGSQSIRKVTTSRALDVGWQELEVEIDGGEPEATKVLRSLVLAGVPVARFEKIDPTLADLLDALNSSGHAHDR